MKKLILVAVLGLLVTGCGNSRQYDDACNQRGGVVVKAKGGSGNYACVQRA